MKGYNGKTTNFFNFLETLDKKYASQMTHPGFFKPSYLGADDITRDKKGNIILEDHELYDTSRVVAAYLTKGKTAANKMHEAIKENTSLADVCKDGKRTDYVYKNIFEETKKLLDSADKFLGK